MQIIAHRRNTVADLDATPPGYGVEMDVRSVGDRLVLHHDPFVPGEDFRTWIARYRHGTLILNVKEDGLESRLLAAMQEHGIEKFFFLDQAFPTLLRMARQGERRCAVRVSEFEHVSVALSLGGLVDWVWVDCFSRFPLTSEDATALKATGFRLCLVSPELQGRSADVEIPQLRALLGERAIDADAVCTKRPDLWER